MTAPAGSPVVAPPETIVVTSVFTADEQHQQQLYALLSANGHDVLEHAPGFLGSALMRCDDGRHIIHQAHWRDDAALAAMLAGPAAQAHMAVARTLGDVQVFRSRHSEGFAGS
jgi:quinol monooxygenase YgiN